MITSARTGTAPDILFYEPHRVQNTGMPPPAGPLRWDWRGDAFQPVHSVQPSVLAPLGSFGFSEKELFFFLEEVRKVLAARISTHLHAEALAVMYAEFDAEDRELAETGLTDYVRLLHDADET